MCMGREHLLIWRCVSVTIWSVKSELSSLKKLLPECTITLFQEIWKIFWGGAQPLPRPFPTGEGETPPQTPPYPLCAYGASIVAPSALQTSRFWRSVLCVPYFQCRLLATLTVTNIVQGKRSQWWKFTGPPPIKNPGYANDRQGTAQRAVSVKTVLNVAQMFVELHLISPALREWPWRSSKVTGNGTNISGV